MKICPYCWEKIQDLAKKCRYCAERLDENNTDRCMSSKINLEDNSLIKKIKDWNPKYEDFIDRVLVKYIKNKEWNDKKAANYLLNHDKLKSLADNLDLFDWLDDNIARELIKGQWINIDRLNMKSFKNLKEETANILFERWLWYYVADYLDNFEKLDQKKLFEKLIQSWERYAIIHNFKKLKEFNPKQFVKELIKNKEWYILLDQRGYFAWLDELVADSLIEDDQIFLLSSRLYRFNKLNKKYADIIIDDWQWWRIVNYIDRFEWLDVEILKNDLLDKWERETLANNIEKFKWLDNEEIVDNLIEGKKWWALIKLMDKITWIDDRIINVLIKNKCWNYLADIADKVDVKYHERIVEWLMNSTFYRESFLKNLDKFEWVDDKEIFGWLMKKKEWELILKNIDKFWFISMEEFSKELMDNEDYICLSKNLDKFKNINRNDLLEKIVEHNYRWLLECTFTSFDWMNKKIANLLIKNWKFSVVAYNLDRFNSIDNQIAEELIENWYWEMVANHIDKIEWLDKSTLYDTVYDAEFWNDTVEQITSDEYLHLIKNKSFTDNEIKKLVKYVSGGSLILDYLTSITDEQAKVLSDLKNLSLNWLKNITDEQAKYLWKINYLQLDWLETITDEQAKRLSSVNVLSLRWLKWLTYEQAKWLCKVNRRLELSWELHMQLLNNWFSVPWKNLR